MKKALGVELHDGAFSIMFEIESSSIMFEIESSETHVVSSQ